MTRLPLALITAALALAACTSGEDAAPGSADTDATTVPTMPASAAEPPDRGAKLQGLIEAWATENDPVGVAAAARFPDGETWLGGAGLADRERGIPVNPADRFEIASITKTFMSALTLRLAEEGLIRLDEPIGQYLPSFPASDEITVRHLLGHRAGVFDPVSELVSDREGPPDPHKVFKPDQLLAAAAAGTPVFPPGSTHDYSNANYWVLAVVLERATGRNIGPLLDRWMLEPLGLRDTSLFDSSLPEIEIVNAYKDLDLDGAEDALGTQPLPGFVTPAWTAGGMISTAGDLVTFLNGLFAGDLLTEASLDEMLDVSSGGGSYALGIYGTSGLWGHDGGIDGYLSAAFHDPQTAVTVAVLTNRFGPEAPQADALAVRLAALANQVAD